jgi:hypothetical protein
MANVTFEDIAFKDARFGALAKHCGYPRAWGRGVMLAIWGLCTELETYTLPASAVNAIGREEDYDHLIEALVLNDLAELAEDGRVRLKGTEGRIEWLAQCRESGRRGGQASAAARKSKRPSSDPQATLKRPSRVPQANSTSGSGSGSDPVLEKTPEETLLRRAAAQPNAATSQPFETDVTISASPAVEPAVQQGLPGVLPGAAAPAEKAPAEKRTCCGPTGDPGKWMLAAEHEFCRLHRERLGLPYAHAYARDRGALRKLPEEYVPRLPELIRRFFDEADPFVFEKAGVHIPAFVQRVSTLLRPKNGNGTHGKPTPTSDQMRAMAAELRRREGLLS